MRFPRKLSDADVAAIRIWWATPKEFRKGTILAKAAEFGIKRETFRRIGIGETYKRTPWPANLRHAIAEYQREISRRTSEWQRIRSLFQQLSASVERRKIESHYENHERSV